MRHIITIDQRTSRTKAILFDDNFNMIDRKVIYHKLIEPKEGWVEANAEEIYSNTIEAIKSLSLPNNITDLSLSITNQRETVVIWDKKTGKPVYNAVVWRCNRGLKYCNLLAEQGYEALIKEKTGLILDPGFSATGARWILDNVVSVRERAEAGNLLFGTIDSWLIWKLTKGKSHTTDYTNASRTLLFNIKNLEWDDDLLKLFAIPKNILPEARPSDSLFGETDIEGFLSAPVKISGVIGNSHGALVGQKCFETGTGKTTYGKSSSVMFNIGEKPVDPPNGMVCSIGFSACDKIYYALEGHIHASGATVDWLCNNLQLIPNQKASDEIANSVPNNGGVYFVPAFTGLGAPWWIPEAKAVISGLTMSTTKEHIVRAALESIAYQVTDVIELISRSSTAPLRELRVDGEAAQNNFLTQFQADMLGFPVRRMNIQEASGIGSVIMNLFANKVFTSLEQVVWQEEEGDSKTPHMKPEERNALQQGWLQSVHSVIVSIKKSV
ncbi:MAG TPA: glycerol kinase GlpK [Bacteroidaceae bacterium]|nr:glycerol kinase GlpK [Bacteroidaceae bacterium]